MILAFGLFAGFIALALITNTDVTDIGTLWFWYLLVVSLILGFTGH